MRKRSFQTVLLLILFASLGLLACDVSTLTSLGGGATKPQVTIQVPLAGAQFREGDDVSVQSTSTDKSGIVRVELSVDGAVVRTDAPPIAQGQTSFSLIQVWKATAGNHTLSVRAFNASGAASDPVLVAITVAPAAAALPSSTAAPTLPPLGGTPVNPAILQTPTLSPGGLDATPTKRPPTKVPPTPTPTISAPPGVWGVSIRVDPVKPTRGQPVTFYVTFLNTTGSPQGYRWRIRIYYPDNMKNSFGDTTPLNTTIPVGISEQASDNGWKVTGPGDCMSWLARVWVVDPTTKQETEFLKPDQSGGPATQFQVCP
jgi:hypothetical protein